MILSSHKIDNNGPIQIFDKFYLFLTFKTFVSDFSSKIVFLDHFSDGHKNDHGGHGEL